jgi:hypothetical protein
MRFVDLLPLGTAILVVGTTFAVAGCASEGYVVTPDTAVVSTYDLATGTPALAAVRDTFLNRAYLPNVLPGAANLDGYAGYVLNVFGAPSPGGVCVQDASRDPVLDPVSYIAAGKAATTEPIGDILTNILVRKGSSASAGFLSFLSVELSDSMRAEVIVEDVARQTAAGVLDEARLQALARTPLRPGVCAREIVLVAVLTSFKTRTYSELGRKAKLAGYGVAADGKLFGSASSFTNRYRLFIESRPIDAYAGPAPRPDTAARTVRRIQFQPRLSRP